LTSIRVQVEIPRADNGTIKAEKRKDGDYKKKPVVIHYNVFLDGKLEARYTRHYGLVGGKLMLDGAIKSAIEDLQLRFSAQVITNRAIAEFQASNFAKDLTIDV